MSDAGTSWAPQPGRAVLAVHEMRVASKDYGNTEAVAQLITMAGTRTISFRRSVALLAAFRKA